MDSSPVSREERTFCAKISSFGIAQVVAARITQLSRSSPDIYHSLLSSRLAAARLSMAIGKMQRYRKRKSFSKSNETSLKFKNRYTYPIANYFAEVEQPAFNPANIVPGIGFSPNKIAGASGLIRRCTALPALCEPPPGRFPLSLLWRLLF
jgi:hypothetical protein